MLKLSSVFIGCALLVGCAGNIFSSARPPEKKTTVSADSAATQGNGSSGSSQTGKPGYSSTGSKVSGSGGSGIDPSTIAEIDPRVASSVVNSGVLAIQKAVEVTFAVTFSTQNQDEVRIDGLFSYAKPYFGGPYRHAKEFKMQVEVGREYEVVFPTFPTTTRIRQDFSNILNMENNPSEDFNSADFQTVQVVASKGRFLGVDSSWQYQNFNAPNRCKFVVMPEDLLK